MSDMEKKISVSEDDLKEVSSGIDVTDPRYRSKIPCPRCWNLVPYTMYDILESRPLVCNFCGLRTEDAFKHQYEIWEEWEKRQKAKEQ